MSPQIDYNNWIPAITREEILRRLGSDGAKFATEHDLVFPQASDAREHAYDASAKVDDRLADLAYAITQMRERRMMRIGWTCGVALAITVGVFCVLQGFVVWLTAAFIVAAIQISSTLLLAIRHAVRAKDPARKLRDALTGCTRERYEQIGPQYHQMAFNLFVRFGAFGDLIAAGGELRAIDETELLALMRSYVAHAHELHSRHDMTIGECTGLEMRIAQISKQIEDAWQALWVESKYRMELDTLPVYYAPRFAAGS